jgi:hypothetical protein
MNAELLPHIPTTDQRAKMASVSIRQSSLMQVTRYGESTEIQYSLVQRAVALGWPRERVELIDEDLGKSGAHAESRGGLQRLLAEISLARVGLVLSFDASCLARNHRAWYQLFEVCSIPHHLEAILSRTQRAHYRLSWQERLARNARPSNASRLVVTLHGLPATFASSFGFDLLTTT